MDLKVLFHNPEELTDAELAHLRQKMLLQRSMPWTAAFCTGFALYFFEAAVLKRTACLRRAAAFSTIGFALGAYSSNSAVTTLDRFKSQGDIVNAFDRRYMKNVLNATGFGSNYVSAKDYAEVGSFKKPY